MKFDSIPTTAMLTAAFVGLVLAAPHTHAQDDDPGAWLQKMTTAIQTTDYVGTVIRIQEGTAEALKVVHVVSDGVVREKMIIQEGNGLEIIRNGNEVHCILPDRKSVLVEEWDDQSTLFSTLPSSDVRFGSEYDVSIVRQDRVAGRKAMMLAIRPHDDFRYGHRIWLDIKTGFPLQTKLIDGDGVEIQQVKFVDITLGEKIHASALRSSTNIDDFRWFAQPRETIKTVTESDWVSGNLPPGFRLMSTHADETAVKNGSLAHMMFSDGLANVSVFIEPHAGDTVARRAHVGASNSYSITIGEFRATAVGEVPAVTAEQIARSMQPK